MKKFEIFVTDKKLAVLISKMINEASHVSYAKEDPSLKYGSFRISTEYLLKYDGTVWTVSKEEKLPKELEEGSELKSIKTKTIPPLRSYDPHSIAVCLKLQKWEDEWNI